MKLTRINSLLTTRIPYLETKSRYNLVLKSLRNQMLIKEKNIVKPSYILVLPPPIPAKSPKKVNKISKFFKKNLISKKKKSYTQASANSTNITRETLKIKKVFSNLQNKKIKLVQKIINGKGKPKLCINMTIKDLSHKQVIIPISRDNASLLKNLVFMHEHQ